jgi:glutaredoxin
MRKEKFVTFVVIFLVLLIAGGVIYFKSTTLSIKDFPSEKVAKYIGEHSVLYTQAGCIHCKEQEDLFGANVKYLNIVDCLKDTQACINANITATPTWIIDGEKYVGVQSIEKLKELTGYPLNK